MDTAILHQAMKFAAEFAILLATVVFLMYDYLKTGCLETVWNSIVFHEIMI